MVTECPTSLPVRTNSNVAFRRIDASGVLVHLRANDIYELNDTGARVWELLQHGSTPSVVVDRLVEEYGADRAEVETSVRQLLGDLSRLGLLDA